MLISGPTHDLTVVTQLEINKYLKNVANEYIDGSRAVVM